MGDILEKFSTIPAAQKFLILIVVMGITYSGNMKNRAVLISKR